MTNDRDQEAAPGGPGPDDPVEKEEIGARHGEVTGVWRILLLSVALAVIAIVAVAVLI